MTESGKTSLAKKLARKLQAEQKGVLVLDTLCDPGWAEGNGEFIFQTKDSEEFLEAFWASKGCFAFVDEGAENAGRYDKAMMLTATRGRHWGHSCFYISQVGTALNPTIRRNCSKLFLFATAREDCKIHAREWNKPELLEASTFKQGEYFYTTRFGKAQRFKLF